MARWNRSIPGVGSAGQSRDRGLAHRSHAVGRPELFAAAHQVTGVLFKGAQATSAGGDNVAVVAGTGCAWLADHPCPDAAIGEQFEAAFDEFADLAERCAVAARTIGDHRGWRHHDLDGRAARATADVMIAMYATSPHHE